MCRGYNKEWTAFTRVKPHPEGSRQHPTKPKPMKTPRDKTSKILVRNDNPGGTKVKVRARTGQTTERTNQSQKTKSWLLWQTTAFPVPFTGHQVEMVHTQQDFVEPLQGAQLQATIPTTLSHQDKTHKISQTDPGWWSRHRPHHPPEKLGR